MSRVLGKVLGRGIKRSPYIALASGVYDLYKDIQFDQANTTGFTGGKGYKQSTLHSDTYLQKSNKRKASGTMASRPRRKLAPKRGRVTKTRKAPYKKKVTRKKAKYTRKKRKITSKGGQRAVVRKRRYDAITGNGRIWLGASSMGRQADFMYTVAESIVMKLLSALGDNRADKKKAPVDLGFGDFFKYIRIIYVAEGLATPSGGDQGIVHNNNTIEFMAGAIATELTDQANEGRYPSQLAVFRLDAGGSDQVMYVDQQFGSTKISLGITSDCKFRNVTLAGEGAGSDSRLAVDANPLNGKLYEFRNRVPIWKQPWTQGLSTLVRDTLAQASLTTSTVDGGVNFNAVNAQNGVTQLDQPPLRPSTLFANAVGSGKNLSIGAGHIFTHRTTYTFEGSIKHFLKSSIRAGHSGLLAGKVPPTGSSYLMCLRPTIKSSTNSAVRIEYDYTHLYSCKASRSSAPKLPTTNFVEA